MNSFAHKRVGFLLTVFYSAVAIIHASEHTKRVTPIHIPNAKQVIKALAGADGTIHVLFDASDGPQYTKSIDSGATFSPAIGIVDSALQKHGLKFHAADMAVGKGGRVHVAMSNNAWKLKLPEEEWSLYYATLAPGAKEFSPVRNLNRKPSEGFSLAADQQGNVTACFLSGKLFAMVSHDDGQHFSAVNEIDAAWDPCNCCTTSATYGSDGRLAIIYREETNNDRDMYIVLWDQRDGSKPIRRRFSGTPWKFDACPVTYFSIHQTATGYVAAWPTKGHVYFAWLDKEGRALPRGEFRTPGTSGMRTGIFAVSASDETTLVTWKNNQILGWQIYGAKGKPQGKPGSVMSHGSGAAAIALRDGNFLVFP
jgi:hypothetical protein